MKSISSLSIRDMDAATVLAWAAYNNHIDIAKLLLAKGVDVNARDRDGRGSSALICAVWSMDVPMVRLLIKNGADANVGNSNWTPLMTAAWAMGTSRGRKKEVLTIIKLLLAK